MGAALNGRKLAVCLHLKTELYAVERNSSFAQGNGGYELWDIEKWWQRVTFERQSRPIH
jgi:hypothetical protein